MAESKQAPRVIYEDKNFLALDKPAGLLTHPTPTSKEPTLVDWLLERYPGIKKVGDPDRPGIVHRLDRDTSGIILIARNQKYFEYLKNIFQARGIKKTYRALVHGRLIPRKGKIEKDILIKSGSIKRTVFKGRGERVAVTEYKVLHYFPVVNFSRSRKIDYKTDGLSWIEVAPLTGRTHQIRVHLASIGHPIIGDKLYTPKSKISMSDVNILVKRQMLHAYSLEWSSAPGKRLKLAVNLPEDIESAIRILRRPKY